MGTRAAASIARRGAEEGGPPGRARGAPAGCGSDQRPQGACRPRVLTTHRDLDEWAGPGDPGAGPSPHSGPSLRRGGTWERPPMLVVRGDHVGETLVVARAVWLAVGAEPVGVPVARQPLDHFGAERPLRLQL